MKFLLFILIAVGVTFVVDKTTTEIKDQLGSLPTNEEMCVNTCNLYEELWDYYKFEDGVCYCAFYPGGKEDASN